MTDNQGDKQTELLSEPKEISIIHLQVPILGLSIQIAEKDKIFKIDGYQVFLSDEFSSHDFLKNKFNMDGPSLETPIAKNGFHLYKIKMSKEKHLGIYCKSL